MRAWLVVVAACSSGHAVAPAPAPAPVPTVSDGATAKAQLGKSVEVHGTARDAKISAAVVANDLVVYCLGVESWPSAVSGKPVVAHGTLAQTDEFAAKPGPDGEVSAGTPGPVYVLRPCRFDPP